LLQYASGPIIDDYTIGPSFGSTFFASQHF